MIKKSLSPAQGGAPSVLVPTSFRHLHIAITLVLSVLIIGTIGYMLIEHLSFLIALYTTVDMMATIGSGSNPTTDAGRIFTLLVVVFGVGSLLYTFAVGMEYLLEGHFNQAVKRRLMDKKIAELCQHYIICGFGRVGVQIAEDFFSEGRSFIVLDNDERNINLCLQRGYLALQGDATQDDMLREAGIADAQCVLVATDNDAHNISITLSARHLNSKLLIVARANHDETEIKLKLAGADCVLSPYAISGHYMAHMTYEPAMFELFDTVMSGGRVDLEVEEIALAPHSRLIGMPMPDAQNQLLHSGMVLVALKRGEQVLTKTAADLTIKQGDVAVMTGLPDQLAKFRSRQGTS